MVLYKDSLMYTYRTAAGYTGNRIKRVLEYSLSARTSTRLQKYSIAAAIYNASTFDVKRQLMFWPRRSPRHLQQKSWLRAWTVARRRVS